MPDHSALLTFQSQLSTNYTYRISVINYTQGFDSQLTTATIRSQKNYYPVRVKERDFQFGIQCRTVNEFDTIKGDIRKSHLKAMSNAAGGICRFRYPDLGIDYLGYILQSPAGVRRFDYSPVLPLSMLLIKDNINSITTFIQQTVNWKDIFGNSIVDMYTAKTSTANYADGVLVNSPPGSGVILHPPTGTTGGGV